jgi:hypothetical protein
MAAQRPQQAKMKFTAAEDDLIRQVMKTSGDQPWATIAEQIPGRTARQVRERWINYLDPTVNTNPWTTEEETLLQNLVNEQGPKWSKMVSQLENRSDIAIKNHYQLMQRRQHRMWKKITMSTVKVAARRPGRPRSSSKAEKAPALEMGGEIPLQGFEWDGEVNLDRPDEWTTLSWAFMLE